MAIILHVQRNCKRILQSEKKKEDLLSDLNKVFDISKCRCFADKLKEQFIPSNCNCPHEDKIINLETYTDQIFNRDAKILLSESQKNKFELALSAIKLSPGKFCSKSFNSYGSISSSCPYCTRDGIPYARVGTCIASVLESLCHF